MFYVVRLWRNLLVGNEEVLFFLLSAGRHQLHMLQMVEYWPLDLQCLWAPFLLHSSSTQGPSRPKLKTLQEKPQSLRCGAFCCMNKKDRSLLTDYMEWSRSRVQTCDTSNMIWQNFSSILISPPQHHQLAKSRDWG